MLNACFFTSLIIPPFESCGFEFAISWDSDSEGPEFVSAICCW